MTIPIRQLTDYELVSVINQRRSLIAVKNNNMPNLTVGKEYTIEVKNASYTRQIIKKKMHTDERGRTYTLDHNIERYGTDTCYCVTDDRKQQYVFRDNPSKGNELRTIKIWDYFEKPYVDTIADTYPEKYQSWIDKLHTIEDLNPFKFYPGQVPYLASVLCLDQAVICGDVGTGKTCMAVAIRSAKNSKRTLIMAPKGTVVGSRDSVSQWQSEINKFSPGTRVYNLFKRSDYDKLLREDGTLPLGVYITYPNAFLLNQSLECVPKSWSYDKREARFRALLRDIGFDAPFNPKLPPRSEDEWHRGLGKTKNGFTCVARPSLCTVSKHQFDMVMIDEAHIMQNLESQVTSTLIRMQPKYRYAFTATPVPNMLPDIFPILGWVCVPNWYHGNKSNARWPFTKESKQMFCDLFLSVERDVTEEKLRGGKSKCVKISPIINEAPRLLRILKPIIAFISKEECNPDVVSCSVETLKVPLGYAQKKLYAYNLNIDHIPISNPKSRYGVQLQRLRGICADPMGRAFNEIVQSNYNPKLITTLSLILDYIARDEQVIHISASIGQTDELARRLDEALISYSRIDSRVLNHSNESNTFKEGETRVMLMGAKCAVGHSFPDCPNMIIGSLEWSYGALHQAIGRVYRVNSKQDANVKVILNSDTIEEAMFDRLADKKSAADICLLGECSSDEYTDVSVDDVLAKHLTEFDENKVDSKPEIEMELEWQKLRDAIITPQEIACKSVT